MIDYDDIDPETRIALREVVERENLSGFNFVALKDYRDVPPEIGILVVEVKEQTLRFGPWLAIIIDRNGDLGVLDRKGRDARFVYRALTREQIEKMLAKIDDAKPEKAEAMELYQKYAAKVFGEIQ